MVATVITIGIMIVAFIGMIISAKIQKTNPNAKILAFVCLLVVLGCAIKFMADSGVFGGESREDREARESFARFRSSVAKKLGDTYAASFKGKNVIVVAPNGEDFNKPQYNLTFQNEIKEAFAGANVTIKGLPYKTSTAENAMDDSMNPKHYEKFLNDNNNADLIIFTVTLPPDSAMIRRFSIWGKTKAPKLIFVDAYSDFFIGSKINQGKIEAIVIQKPGLTIKDYETPAPSDLNKAFEARYLLINKKNVQQVLNTHKDLFPR